MSKLEVDAIEPQSGTTLTIGASGDSVNIASGATITDFTSTGIDDNATSTAITINSSEQIEFTAGTALLPAITTTGDTNTGMWFPAADTIAFSEGGAEAMRIDSGGNVIIGSGGLDTSGIGGTFTALNIRAGSGYPAIYGQTTATATNKTALSIIGATSGASAGGAAELLGVMEIACASDSSTNATGFIRWYTGSGGSFSERMRITSNGFTKHSNTGVYDTYTAADDAHQFVSNIQTDSTLWVTNTNASYSDIVQKNETARGPNSAFSLFTTTTGNLTDDQHRLRGDGNAYCDGSWNGGGADYAEYFEWSDGNINNEDRVGYSVVLDGNKIRKATSEDNTSNIIGVVSGNPFVVGDDAWSKWHEKYLKDDFGRYILEEYTITEWQEEITENETTNTISKSFETDKIPSDEIIPENATVLTHEVNGDILKRRILNPNFDETSEYITREDRKEWDTVGLLGKVRIRKAQPVKDTWIKMRDISETVEEYLIK